MAGRTAPQMNQRAAPCDSSDRPALRWRFAHMKRNLSGRAAVVGVLEELPVICSLAVAAGSMIMIGIMLYKDWPQ